MTSLQLSILCRCCFASADVVADVDAAVVDICIAAAISFASRSKSSMLLGTWCWLNAIAAAFVLRFESALESAVSSGARSVDAKSSNEV